MTPIAVILSFLCFGLAVALVAVVRNGAAWESQARRLSVENDLLKAQLFAGEGMNDR